MKPFLRSRLGWNHLYRLILSAFQDKFVVSKLGIKDHMGALASGWCIYHILYRGNIPINSHFKFVISPTSVGIVPVRVLPPDNIQK